MSGVDLVEVYLPLLGHWVRLTDPGPVTDAQRELLGVVMRAHRRLDDRDAPRVWPRVSDAQAEELSAVLAIANRNLDSMEGKGPCLASS